MIRTLATPVNTLVGPALIVMCDLGGRIARWMGGLNTAAEPLIGQIQWTPMSAFGPKRTCVAALHESAFGGKADMAFCGISLSRSLLGVKQTWHFALHMSAFDP